MKRFIVLTAMILLTISFASAQVKVAPNNPTDILSPTPGYITINEFVGGIGLKGRVLPYAQGFFGFTTIHGYQINESFAVGGGTGFLSYNGGSLIPLFVD